MYSKTMTVVSGLESRPAALFVQMAGRFQSQISIAVEEKKVNAKSIMGVISLGILDGDTVSISAEGADENDAVEALALFLSEEREND